MKNLLITVAVLSAIVALSWSIIDKETHKWHPIGPNVKFGTLLTLKGEEDEPLVAGTALHGEPKPYVKERFEWNSNEITEDSVKIVWSDALTDSTNILSITATSFDYGPDSNAWVRFDWCSRHGEVRAVRVE